MNSIIIILLYTDYRVSRIQLETTALGIDYLNFVQIRQPYTYNFHNDNSNEYYVSGVGAVSHLSAKRWSPIQLGLSNII